MKTTITILISLSTLTTAFADPELGPQPPQPTVQTAPPTPVPTPVAKPPVAQPLLAVAPTAKPAASLDTKLVPASDAKPEAETGWRRPAVRMLHGIRIGYNFIANFEKPTREQDDGSMKSLKDEFGLKTPHTMILGYEAMYRIVGHSWLNVVMVGNISVAGLEQSKFIPTASGLIGAELNESFQLGVGVNLIPDEKAPTHMIVAAGWTPKVGSIYTPLHFYFVPDAAGNHRSGLTLGVTW